MIFECFLKFLYLKYRLTSSPSHYYLYHFYLLKFVCFSKIALEKGYAVAGLVVLGWEDALAYVEAAEETKQTSLDL